MSGAWDRGREGGREGSSECTYKRSPHASNARKHARTHAPKKRVPWSVDTGTEEGGLR